jgi:hypothetical protein
MNGNYIWGYANKTLNTIVLEYGDNCDGSEDWPLAKEYVDLSSSDTEELPSLVIKNGLLFSLVHYCANILKAILMIHSLKFPSETSSLFTQNLTYWRARYSSLRSYIMRNDKSCTMCISIKDTNIQIQTVFYMEYTKLDIHTSTSNSNINHRNKIHWKQLFEAFHYLFHKCHSCNVSTCNTKLLKLLNYEVVSIIFGIGAAICRAVAVVKPKVDKSNRISYGVGVQNSRNWIDDFIFYELLFWAWLMRLSPGSGKGTASNFVLILTKVQGIPLQRLDKRSRRKYET